MLNLISYLLVGIAGLLSIIVAVFVIEVISAIALARPEGSLEPGKHRPRRIAVLVPAHNESTGLLPTIADIKAQLYAGDRLLVVADNCSDDTAAVAASAGAEVIERKAADKIGKGYALDWGFRHLAAAPPDVVIVIDADCRLAAGTIDRLAAVCATMHRPVQALDLMTAPEQSPINHRVGEFAWRVKNWVRPLGLMALKLPCQLMGTGMAFPWDVVRSADLASGRIVEDIKLGLDLALSGSPPLFCPSAVVTSEFPLSVKGASAQRERWEYGHINLILTLAPRLLYLAILRGNLGLLALTLDMAIPPLTLLGLSLIVTVALAGLAAFYGCSSAALIIGSVTFAAFVLAVFLAWLKYGRDILPPRSFLLIAVYLFGKLRIYCRFVSQRSAPRWIRTDRN
jgi:cellulose synthase/poly-beta-1,6-N-acetylglucosamine synthase-like glycosyltransferase